MQSLGSPIPDLLIGPQEVPVSLVFEKLCAGMSLEYTAGGWLLVKIL
jgi:hypothetical protein